MKRLRSKTLILLLSAALLALFGCAEDGGGPAGPSPDPDPDPDPPAENTAPQVAIVFPVDGFSEYVDSYDADRDQWYLEIDASAIALDAEDGDLKGSSIVWEATPDGQPMETVGSGDSPKIRLYSHQPFGTPHTLRVRATDSDGATTSATVELTINILS